MTTLSAAPEPKKQPLTSVRYAVVEPDEILRRAWEAVEKAAVPEPLHEVAFKEAVELLRGGSVPEEDKQTRDRAKQKSRSQKPKPTVDKPLAVTVDGATFFAQLSAESGVSEKDLRDILGLSGDVVKVTTPTRNLGSSIAEQARSVIALVATARGVGLGEEPVDAGAVSDEAKRKRCFQSRKFTSDHLGPMKGFNSAGRGEIVLTSKWPTEFQAAVEQALGRTKDAEDQA
jgi:hypothetical protein